jgi:hypothetical protein
LGLLYLHVVAAVGVGDAPRTELRRESSMGLQQRLTFHLTLSVRFGIATIVGFEAKHATRKRSLE